MIELPYLVEEKTLIQRTIKYNPNYGDDRVCECGHTYYRHFDSYEDMYPCGCKYCGCREFIEQTKPNNSVEIRWTERAEELIKVFDELEEFVEVL
jgi:hypothetical protein